MTDETDISKAVALYLGPGVKKFPSPSLAPLRSHFGSRSLRLGRDVERLVDEMGSLEVAPELDLSAAYAEVLRVFTQRHPELTESAVGALAWNWSWENR